MKRTYKKFGLLLLLLGITSSMQAGLYKWTIHNISPFEVEIKLYGKFCGNILKHAFVDESPSKTVEHKQTIDFESVGVKWGCCLGRAQAALPGEGFQPVKFVMATSEQVEAIQNILEDLATSVETAGEKIGKGLKKVTPKVAGIVDAAGTLISGVLRTSARLDAVSMCQSRDFLFVVGVEKKKVGDYEFDYEQPFLMYTP